MSENTGRFQGQDGRVVRFPGKTSGVDDVLAEVVSFRREHGISGIITLQLAEGEPTENKRVQWNLSLDTDNMTKADWYYLVGTLERLKVQLAMEMIEGVETDGPEPQEGRQ